MTEEQTSWTLIRSAAAGSDEHRADFVKRYAPIIRATLERHWSNTSYLQHIDDVVQEVLYDCLRESGVLARADPSAGHDFRGFLFGVTVRAALKFETRERRRRTDALPDDPDAVWAAATTASISDAFDRAWANAILRDALKHQLDVAHREGPAAVRRVELLRLRFHEDLAIRDIARHWNVEPAKLHHDYALARKEFRAALIRVLAFHDPRAAIEPEAELDRLREIVGL